MKKISLVILGTCIIVLLLVMFGVYKFNHSNSLTESSVGGGGVYSAQPKNDFEVIEVLSQACQVDADCETPVNYALLSSCPYDARCVNNSCTVVCPQPFSGKKIVVPD